MFGLIQRDTKEACVFCILNNRTKHNLLLIVKNNVSTAINEDNENINVIENESCKTRIYSDCYSSYQINDFHDMGYILETTESLHLVWLRPISY